MSHAIYQLIVPRDLYAADTTQVVYHRLLPWLTCRGINRVVKHPVALGPVLGLRRSDDAHQGYSNCL